MRQDDIQILNRLAYRSYETRDYKKAFLYYSELYREDLLEMPSFNSFLVCVKALNKPNAEKLFEEGISKFPTSFHIKRNFINYLIGKEKFEKAELIVDEILNEYPDDFYAIDLKALILSRTGKLESAIEIMEKKISSPKILQRSHKGVGKEVFFSFKTYFQILEEHLDITKAKQALFELLLKDGRAIDNINFIFDKAEFSESSDKLLKEKLPDGDVAEFIKQYEFIFHKVDKLFSKIEHADINRTLVVEKRATINYLRQFIGRVKGFLLSIYDEEKKKVLIKKYETKKVFISYSRLDRDFALKVHDNLKSKGFDIFLDEYKLEINDYLQTELEKRIKQSDYVVSIVSKNSLLSEWVGQESIHTLMDERYDNQTKKYISVVIDRDVFKWGYYIDLVEEVDIKMDTLFELTLRAFKLKVSSRIYDISRERLIQLRSSLGDILFRIREYLSIDFTDGLEYDKNINKLVDYLLKPKPELKKAA